MLSVSVTWWLVIGATLIALIAQFRVMGAFKRFGQIRTLRGLTGAEVAKQILRESGITDVEIERTDSWLGDHYDPTKKVLCLSPGVFDSNSVSAVGIAAHECGHAIQHKHAYWPLQLRMTVVPVTMVASNLLPLVVIGGFWFHMMWFITLGIFVYAILTLFQLITLPVEFDASNRAKRILRASNMVMPDEADGVNTVLNAAAWTYVAAFLSALTHLLHLLAIRDSRD